TFTAGLSGLLDQVNIPVLQHGNPGTLTVEIRTVDGGGVPTSTVLGSGSLPLSAFTPCCALPVPLTSVPLTTPAPVTAGTQYAIVLTGTDAFDTGDSTADPYAGGRAYETVFGV